VAIGAASIGAWGEGALLLLLFSSAGALEAFAMHRTRRAIDSLFKEQPRTATRLDADGTETPVPVAELLAGDLLLIRPGDVFPVDAKIETGETAADESTLSGESLPVPKAAGTAVFAGTLNLWGAPRVRVSRPASESSLQKIILLIQEAQKQKAPSQRFTDKFGTGYTLLILGLTVAMFFVWWLAFGLPPFVNDAENKSAFYRAMTLLVVASPCALVLSIPSAILAAIAWGARSGILFRGGAAIEKLAEVDCVALDKTGTLTTGKLAVVGVESFPPGSETEILRMAVALESGANHPIACAILAHGKQEGVAVEGVTQFQNRTGFGISGNIGGVACVLGRREFVEKTGGAALSDAPESDATEVWLRAGERTGRILLRDQPRPEAAPTIAALAQNGVRTVMLTGDRESAAKTIGGQLGIEEIHAGLSPEEKVDRVRELAQRGLHPAMIGDGVNDAPALAAAYVSVGMGTRGADAALEQCDVVLMTDRIERCLDARNLSLRARAIIRQNLVLSLGTIGVMVLASIGIGVPLALGVFAHESSTVLVCLNSLRLLLGKAK
jgi:Cd2+/Zn2+-exporting ATPase